MENFVSFQLVSLARGDLPEVQRSYGTIALTGYLVKLNHHEMTNPSQRETGLWADLLNAALSEVNWIEIAKNIIEGKKEP